MTQTDLIHKFSDLSDGFSIEERVSLTDVLELFRAGEEKVLGCIGAAPGGGPVSAVLPHDLQLGDQIGLDYLQYTPATDEAPRQSLISPFVKGVRYHYIDYKVENPEWEVTETPKVEADQSRPAPQRVELVFVFKGEEITRQLVLPGFLQGVPLF